MEEGWEGQGRGRGGGMGGEGRRNEEGQGRWKIGGVVCVKASMWSWKEELVYSLHSLRSLL